MNVKGIMFTKEGQNETKYMTLINSLFVGFLISVKGRKWWISHRVSSWVNEAMPIKFSIAQPVVSFL